MAVVINGKDLTIEEVIRVCRGMEKVEISEEAQVAVNKARGYIDSKLVSVRQRAFCQVPFYIYGCFLSIWIRLRSCSTT